MLNVILESMFICLNYLNFLFIVVIYLDFQGAAEKPYHGMFYEC